MKNYLSPFALDAPKTPACLNRLPITVSAKNYVVLQGEELNVFVEHEPKVVIVLHFFYQRLDSNSYLENQVGLS